MIWWQLICLVEVETRSITLNTETPLIIKLRFMGGATISNRGTAIYRPHRAHTKPLGCRYFIKYPRLTGGDDGYCGMCFI